MSDLVERLREYRMYNPNRDSSHHPICDEAAARIEQLEANKSEQVLELKYHIDQQYAEIVRFQGRIKKLEAALREAGCDHCTHWFDRAALEERT